MNILKHWIAASVGFMMLLVTAFTVLAQPPGGGPELQKPPGLSAGLMRPQVMTVFDANDDGNLSPEEIASAPQALRKLDKNGDGKLDREELFQVGSGPGSGSPDNANELGGSSPVMGGQASSFQAITQPNDDDERKILRTIDAILQEQGPKKNVPAADGRLLRMLAEAIDAKTVVEFGTSKGISALCISLALRKTGGKLLTYEIDPDTVAIARKNFKRAGVAEIVTVVEGDAHEKARNLKGPIDLVFIDADKEGYLDYLQKTLPLVRPGGLICAHNKDPLMASADFLKAVTTNPALETLFISTHNFNPPMASTDFATAITTNQIPYYIVDGGMIVSLKKR